MTTDCIFCRIMKGEIPAVKIWEEKGYLAFLAMKPINPGHVLVVPKKHEDYIFDLNEEEYAGLMLKAREVARIMKQKLNAKRIGVVIEGFGVPHVHIHLIPINKQMELNPERARLSNDEELEKIACLLR